jgi:hypothetical protein
VGNRSHTTPILAEEISLNSGAAWGGVHHHRQKYQLELLVDIQLDPGCFTPAGLGMTSFKMA